MLFFAWGTNMDEEHFRGWLPSARKVSVASLRGYEFRFHKRRPQGAKADAFHTGNPDDVVWGVIYELAEADVPELDAAQRAANYGPTTVTVVDREGGTYAVTTYVAAEGMIDAKQLPFASYKDPIVRAARANSLPEDYIAALEQLPAAPRQ